MWENEIIMRHETRISEASTDLRQNITKDFNELYYCSIKEQKLFKHHDNHRQVVKRYFTDSTTEFRD